MESISLGLSFYCHFRPFLSFQLDLICQTSCTMSPRSMNIYYISLSLCFYSKRGISPLSIYKMGSRRKPPRLDMLDFSRQPGNKPLKTFQDASNDKSTSRLVELGVLTNVFLCPELWLTSHIILSSAPLKYHRCFLWVDIDEASGERKSRTSMSSETVWLEG